MKKGWIIILWILSIPVQAAAPQKSVSSKDSSGQLPDFGNILNDDGDFTFHGENEAAWRENMRRMFESLRGLSVGTISYSIATGSDVLLYPSQAGSPWAWRDIDEEHRGRFSASALARAPEAVRGGFDGVGLAAKTAKELGFLFVPNFRLNDWHFAAGDKPETHYLTGRFWMENHSRLTFQKPPMPHPELAPQKHLFDFSHAEVRRHRLAVIFEAIDRYRDVMDGFQLDFVRFPIFFLPEEAPSKAHLITEMLQDVRTRLDEAGRATGKRMALIVRVPATLKNCEWAGLDVRAWLDRGLVDILIPSQIMTLAHDQPLEEFVSLAAGRCRIYAAVLDRTNDRFAFTGNAPTVRDYVKRTVTPDMARGVALNYRRMGVAGFEFYNFNLPLTAQTREVLRAFHEPEEKLLQMPRTYAVTPAFFLDHLDTYEYRKQIPFKLSQRHPERRVSLFLGESSARGNDRAALQIGFAVMPPSDTMSIVFNGTTIFHGDVSAASQAVQAKTGPRAHLVIPLEEVSWREGWNELVFKKDSGGSGGDIVITDLTLGFLPK